jgi:hypothetical protein
MLQAIVTRYHGPTNTRGLRYSASASAWAGRAIRACDNAVNAETNSALAARKLAEKFGWHGIFVAGGMPDGKGRVYVHISNDPAHAPFGIRGQDWFFVPAPDQSAPSEDIKP